VLQQTVGQETIKNIPPIIIDADGLNIISEIPDWHQLLPKETILTPHPGEMSRLTGLSISDINSNRYEIAIEWAKTWEHIVILKGANTIIASPEGKATVLPFSNPGLSTAGTGDVLAGAVAGMLSQGLNPYHAAVTGAYLHGLAGEICREEIGVAGMIAGDVAAYLAKALRQLE
jgi:NAD(P)H-hydrate epimerase